MDASLALFRMATVILLRIRYGLIFIAGMRTPKPVQRASNSNNELAGHWVSRSGYVDRPQRLSGSP
jgi:hypothetical protein